MHGFGSMLNQEPPRRRTEVKAIIGTIVILVLIAVAYFLVEGFRSAPMDAPDGESPQTEAPSGVEPPAANTD